MNRLTKSAILLSILSTSLPSYSAVLGLEMGSKPGEECNLNKKNICEAKIDHDNIFVSGTGVYGEDTGLCALHLTSKEMSGNENTAIFNSLNQGLKDIYGRSSKMKESSAEWKVKQNKDENETIRKIKTSTFKINDNYSITEMSVYFVNSTDSRTGKVTCISNK